MQDLSETLETKPSKIDAAKIMSLDHAFRPNADELSSMIQAICVRKNWSRNFFASLLSMGCKQLRRYEMQQDKPSGPICRLIWLFYILDTAPELAFNPLYIATWGKTERVIPSGKRRYITAEQRDKVAAVIAQWKKEGIRKPMRDMRKEFEITPHHIRRICESVGYNIPNGTQKSYRTKRMRTIFKPESIWMNVDWRKTDKELSEETTMSLVAVIKTRHEFRKFHPRENLRRHIIACGKDIDKFGPVLRDAVQGRPPVMRSIVP